MGGYTGHSAKSEAVKMIEHADKNADGVVDFDEFKQVWYRKVLSTNDQYIHRVFSVFDESGDAESAGNEEEKELAASPEDDGEGMNDGFLGTVKRMIQEVDANKDGKIDFDEFKTAMQEDLESGKLGFAKGDDDKYGGLIGPKIVE